MELLFIHEPRGFFEVGFQLYEKLLDHFTVSVGGGGGHFLGASAGQFDVELGLVLLGSGESHLDTFGELLGRGRGRLPESCRRRRGG